METHLANFEGLVFGLREVRTGTVKNRVVFSRGQKSRVGSTDTQGAGVSRANTGPKGGSWRLGVGGAWGLSSGPVGEAVSWDPSVERMLW